MSQKVALVTGASGYIALHVVKELLQGGWTVHATVRSLKNDAKVKPIAALDSDTSGKLKLFEADLLKEGSFLESMQGCSVVIHVASPFILPEKVKDPQTEFIEPALQGTRNVLESVNQTPTVKRVVLTSSVGAMYGDAIDIQQREAHTVRESDWNDTSGIEHQPYSYSKVIAEREAWKIAEAQDRWELVAICPAMVVGPTLTPSSSSGSLDMVQQIMSGNLFFGAPDIQFAMVDVRDVGIAHAKAAEAPAARGRYIIASNKSTSMAELAKIIHTFHQHPVIVPTWKVPNPVFRRLGPFWGLSKRFIEGNLGLSFSVDNSRAIAELGLKYRPLEETLRDHYNQWVTNKKLTQ